MRAIMKNKELAKKAYQKFGEGDIEGVLDLFDAKIEWRECKGFPFIKGEGVSIGPDAIVKDVFSKIPEYYDNFKIEIEDLIEEGDRIVMSGYYTGTWKATSKKFKANAAHIWTLKNGKFTRFFQAVDTATIVNPVKVKAM
jgi:ketosteroid isomerase-like protein